MKYYKKQMKKDYLKNWILQINLYENSKIRSWKYEIRNERNREKS